MSRGCLKRLRWWRCSQFEVKDVAWDAGLGAEALDVVLLEHFADEFQAKHGADVRAHPKAVAKLKRQASAHSRGAGWRP